jgi:NodT family efflux transporter outer membrane factor (OMF) lipoprotein
MGNMPVIGCLNRHLSLFFLIGLLCSCVVFDPPEREPMPVSMPGSYGVQLEGMPTAGRWWESFQSAELNDLVNAALTGNFDIRSARARLEQARAQLKKTGAERYPTLDGEAGAAHRRARMETQSGASVSTVDTFNLGLAAGYELDLWGRLRALNQAEIMQVSASRDDLETAAVSVSAVVVDTWAQLVGVRQQMRILEGQIQINQDLLELQRFRLQNGLSTALEVSQQMESLAAVRADLPLLQAREQTLRNALSFLTGKAGGTDMRISGQQLPELIPLPDAGIPSDLLTRRPDVRAANYRLQSADWRVSAARADRLPSLNFTAGAGYASEDFDRLFSNWFTSLAGSLTAPLFDAGRRAAEVDRTRASAEESLAEYGRIVAAAFNEVADGLAREHRQREYIDRLQEQLSAARMARQEARIRYLNGDSDYLNFLVEFQNVQLLERRIVAQQLELIRLRVGLYRSLGGDWTRELDDRTAARLSGTALTVMME